MADDTVQRKNRDDQALLWLVRRNSGEFTPEDDAALARWRAIDPANEAAYVRAEEAWDVSASSSRADAHRREARGIRERRRRLRLTVRVAAAAAMIALAFGAVMFLRVKNAPPERVAAAATEYSTGKGERRTLNLQDGSTIELNTDTVVRVSYSDSERRVTLERGQAFFSVRSDTARPFSVDAANGTTTVLGTRFEVYRQPDRVRVSNVEGRVNVAVVERSSVVLVAGQALTYSIGSVGAVETIDVEVVEGWRNGQLVFKETPLATAVEDMARYHDVTFNFESPEAAALKLNGVFRIADIYGFIHALPEVHPIVVRRTDRIVSIRMK